VKIPYLTTSIEEDIAWSIALIPLWWVTGLTLVIYQGIAFWVLIKLVLVAKTNRVRLEIPPVVAWIFPFVLLLFLSLGIGLLEQERGRVIGALYSNLLWVMGVIMAFVVYHISSPTTHIRFAKAMLFPALFAGVLTVYGVYEWEVLGNYQDIRIETPVYQAIGKTAYPLVNNSVRALILTADWYEESLRPRVSVMGTYPVASAGLMLLFMGLLSLYWLQKEKRGLGHLWVLLFVGFALTCFLYTNSRGATFSMLAALAGLWVMMTYRLGVVSVLGLLIFLLAAWPSVSAYWDSLLLARNQSTGTRKELYEETIAYAMQHSPILGVGVKPQEPGAAFALGSHSTYLSALIRSGMLGMIALILWQLYLIVISIRLLFTVQHPFYRKQAAAYAFVIFSMTVFMVTEEVDIPQVLMFIYFIIIGLFSAMLRDIHYHALSLAQARQDDAGLQQQPHY
jgi:hypothetical protein